jgi:hypothetical protein
MNGCGGDLQHSVRDKVLCTIKIMQQSTPNLRHGGCVRRSICWLFVTPSLPEDGCGGDLQHSVRDKVLLWTKNASINPKLMPVVRVGAAAMVEVSVDQSVGYLSRPACPRMDVVGICNIR